MTSILINQDLDSSIVKGLRLLHSSDSDSENQLKQLWKQSVFEKYGTSRVPTSVLYKIKIPAIPKRAYFDSEKVEIDSTSEYKKTKLENSSALLPKSASSSPRSNSSLYSFDITEIDDNSNSDEDEEDDEPSFEVYDDRACMKCKTSFSSTNNKLVECVDCQKHYHQQCHFPPITEMDLSDPRFVWYCSACEENITTTANSNEKVKTSDLSSPTKFFGSTKSSSPPKHIRSFGLTYSSKISTSNGSKLSSDFNSKQNISSFNLSEKKSSSMKKHGIKKHEKKKSSK